MHKFAEVTRIRGGGKLTVLLAAAAALFAAFAVHGETYYYVGGELVTNTAWNAVALWATEGGSAAESAPVADDTIVFTNGKHVAFSNNATIPCNIIKRGAGELRFNKALTLSGMLTLEQGRFSHYNGGALTLNDTFELKVAGTASKDFYIYGGGIDTHHTDIVIPSYSETDEASGTATFYAHGSTAFVTTLKGAAGTTTRLSADIYPNNHDKMSYTLNWNPGAAATLDIVNRDYYIAVKSCDRLTLSENRK